MNAVPYPQVGEGYLIQGRMERVSAMVKALLFRPIAVVGKNNIYPLKWLNIS